MKVKNIMFSGFAAAILMGTAQAATTPFEIASKAYVDSRISSVSDSTSEVIGDMDDLNDGNDTNFGNDTDTVVEALNDLDDALNTKQNVSDSTVAAKQSGSYAHITANNAVGTNLASLDDAVAALESKVGNDSVSDQIEDALGDLGTNGTTGDPNTVEDALAGKVDKSAVATSISSQANASQNKWASEKAVADALAGVTGDIGSIQQQIDEALGDLGTNPTTQEENTVEQALALKQNEADSNVAAANMVTGSHLTAGHGVAANLVALDTNLVAAEGDIDDLETAVGSYDSTTGQGTGLLKDVADLQDTLNDQTNGLTPRVQALETTVGDSTAGLVKDVDDLQDTMGTGTLTGFSSGVDTVIAALNDLQANKLNKPIPNTCSAQSQHCVLHMDNTGALSWVDITVPYMEVSGGSEEPAGGEG